MSVSFPYQEGATLSLRRLSPAPDDESATVEVRVEELKQPSTLSCVMKVTTAVSSPAILKMYDPRFSTQLRSDNEAKPWDGEMEKMYLDFISEAGAADVFLKRLRYDYDFEELEEGWTPAEFEALLQDVCLDMFNAETSTYKMLSEFQGHKIPRLLARVALPVHAKFQNGTDQSSTLDDLLWIKGILVEFIPGFTLSDMAEQAPRAAWQSIIDQAVRIVGVLSDHSILNKDVRPSNVVVTPDAGQQCGFRAVMIDFAACEFRGEETDDEWGRKKWSEDEEGRIGVLMQGRLKKLGFDLHYKNSKRFVKWAGDD